MTKDEALKQALEALEGADQIDVDMQDAITAIKEALAQPVQEPMFKVDVAKRKWESLQADGHEMQHIAFVKGVFAGIIDAWGKVVWLEATPPLPVQPAAQVEPVAWEYRWLNPDNYSNTTERMLAWQRVEPTRMETLENKLQEFRAYAYLGKPCYEVRALYTTPPSQPAARAQPPLPVQPAEADELLTALGFDPDAYRTDGGWLNVPKIIAAIKSPEDYPTLAQPVQRQPLTSHEIEDLWDAQLFNVTDLSMAIDFVRDIEAAHGIGAKP